MAGVVKRLGLLVALLSVVSMAYVVMRIWPESARPARPIKLSTGAWEPFIGPDLAGHGPIARVVTETIRLMGWEPELSFSSWALVLERMDRGEVSGGFPFIPTSSRAAEYQFSAAICDFQYVLFYNESKVPGQGRGGPGSIENLNTEHLERYKFGKVEGYEVWKELAEATARLEFEEYGTSVEAFRALARGEIDFLPESRVHGFAVLRALDVPGAERNIAYLGAKDGEVFGNTETLHLLMRNPPPGFLEAFDETLRGVKKTARYKLALEEIEAIETKTARSSIVRLQPVPGQDFVRVSDTGDGGFIVPAGTRAAVLEWPAAFAPGAGEPDSSPRCVVELLNGPQRGRVVRVDARAVVLTD